MDRELANKRLREEVKARGVTSEEIQNIWNTLGVRKATMAGIKIVQALCKECKDKVMQNSKMGIEEYCEKCQCSAQDILRSYL